jgi:hypothetical protein
MKATLVPTAIWVALAVGIVLVNAGNLLDRAWKLPVEAVAVGVLSTAVACLIAVLIWQRGNEMSRKRILRPRDPIGHGKLIVDIATGEGAE